MVRNPRKLEQCVHHHQDQNRRRAQIVSDKDQIGHRLRIVRAFIQNLRPKNIKNLVDQQQMQSYL